MANCEVCDGTRASGGCTNGRCLRCHREWCGPGGSTGPGHARRWPAGHPNGPPVDDGGPGDLLGAALAHIAILIGHLDNAAIGVHAAADVEHARTFYFDAHPPSSPSSTPELPPPAVAERA